MVGTKIGNKKKGRRHNVRSDSEGKYLIRHLRESKDTVLGESNSKITFLPSTMRDVRLEKKEPEVDGVGVRTGLTGQKEL